MHPQPSPVEIVVISLLAATTFFLALFIISIRPLLQEIIDVYRLNKHGIFTVGYIIQHHVSHKGKRNTAYYHVIYSYNHKDKLYKHEQSVSREQFNLLPEGVSVRIRIHPDDPDIACLAEKERDNRQFLDVVIQAGTAIFYLILTILCLIATILVSVSENILPRW